MERGKHRSSAMSSNKGTTSSDYQHHNGRIAQEDCLGGQFGRKVLRTVWEDHSRRLLGMTTQEDYLGGPLGMKA